MQQRAEAVDSLADLLFGGIGVVEAEGAHRPGRGIERVARCNGYLALHGLIKEIERSLAFRQRAPDEHAAIRPGVRNGSGKTLRHGIKHGFALAFIQRADLGDVAVVIVVGKVVVKHIL